MSFLLPEYLSCKGDVFSSFLMSSFPKRFLQQVGTLLAVDDASNSKISSRVDDCNCLFRSLAQASFSVLIIIIIYSIYIAPFT